jgi:pyruvate dehydrogenase E1 component alpha subunit
MDVEQWLHVYEQMVKIREFEEKANELYLKAIMPGLTHLYSGQEAVAVGVCEALRREDYITRPIAGMDVSCQRRSVDLMFAELLGKRPLLRKGGSMHIADPASGNSARTRSSAGARIVISAALSAKKRGGDQVAVFFGEGLDRACL